MFTQFEIYSTLFYFMALFVGVFSIYFFIEKHNSENYKNHADQPDQVPEKEIEQSLRNAGTNTNSIYHLYKVFDHYIPNLRGSSNIGYKPLVGYSRARKHNIMMTDPLCPPDRIDDVVLGYVKMCRQQKKEALFFAVSEGVAREAQKLGFKAIKIGQEPVFDLRNYSTDNIAPKIKSSIRQAFKKGLSIEEYTLNELQSKNLMYSLNEVLNQWFLTRPSDELIGITEVNPMAASADKKYFIARRENDIEAFLVCSPIYGRNGYFIHDLIRKQASISGVSEALVVTALDAFKEQGYDMATLGISPLAGLELTGVNNNYPRLNKILIFVFNHFKFPSRFKDLFFFKAKFEPTHYEPAYFIVPPSGLKMRHVLAVMAQMSDLNLLNAIRFKIRQWSLGYELPKPLQWAIDNVKVTLPPLIDLSFETIFVRLKVTISLLFLNIYTYIYTTDFNGHIEPNALQNFGFSYSHFVDHKWFILLTSNFVHYDIWHLVGNMTMLVFFCGSLEILGGSVVALSSFLIGMQANIPTGLFVLPLLQNIEKSLFTDTVTYVDVGASLGIMSCLGTLLYFFKPKIRYPTMAGFILIFTAYALISNQLIGLNHGFALITGYLIAQLYVHREVSQKYFETVKNPYFELKVHRPRLVTIKGDEKGL